MAKTGRPTDYSEEVAKLALEYVSDDESSNYLSHNHGVPSVVGLCRVINRARSTVYKWAEEDDKEFSDILDILMDFQHLTLVSGGLKNTLNPTITKLMLTKHGYSDRQDVEVVDKTPPSPEKRKSRIGELLNKCRGE